MNHFDFHFQFQFQFQLRISGRRHRHDLASRQRVAQVHRRREHPAKWKGFQMLKILWNQANRVSYHKHPKHCHDLVPKCISPCIRTILECLQIKVKCQNILLRNFSFLKEAAHAVLQLDSCKHLWIFESLVHIFPKFFRHKCFFFLFFTSCLRYVFRNIISEPRDPVDLVDLSSAMLSDACQSLPGTHSTQLVR